MAKPSRPIPMSPVAPLPDSDLVWREKQTGNGNSAQSATQQERLRDIDARLNALMQELHFTLQPRLKVIAINPQLVADADVQIVLLE